MHICLVVNVENMKLYEPSMLDQKIEQVFPTIEKLSLDTHAKLVV